MEWGERCLFLVYPRRILLGIEGKLCSILLFWIIHTNVRADLDRSVAWSFNGRLQVAKCRRAGALQPRGDTFEVLRRVQKPKNLNNSKGRGWWVTGTIPCPISHQNIPTYCTIAKMSVEALGWIHRIMNSTVLLRWRSAIWGSLKHDSSVRVSCRWLKYM